MTSLVAEVSFSQHALIVRLGELEGGYTGANEITASCLGRAHSLVVHLLREEGKNSSTGSPSVRRDGRARLSPERS